MVIPSIIILLAFQPICRLFKRWQYVVAFLTIQIHIDLKNALKYVQASAAELTHANVTVKMSWQAFKLFEEWAFSGADISEDDLLMFNFVTLVFLITRHCCF